jgi:tetratricopeptide (TPR) repeat protein
MNRVSAVLLLCMLTGCRFARWDGAVSHSLTTSRQYSQQGVAASEQGHWDRAEALLSQAVRTCPTNGDARKSYAEALWNQGKQAEAAGQLEEAIRTSPEDAESRSRLAEMQLAMRQVDLAYRTAEQAIDLDPKLASAWAVRARVMRAYHRPVDALADFHRALSSSPDDRVIPMEIAEIYRELKQPQRALATLQGVAEMYPPGEEPQNVLRAEGNAFLSLHRYEDAVTSFAMACNRQPSPDPDLLCQLAESQRLAGHMAEAAETARRALSLSPTHAPSRELLERVEIAHKGDTPWNR